MKTRILAKKHIIIACMFFLIETTTAHNVKAADNNTFYTPPFLVIDLDGDGVEIISLEKSKAYFDIDADGKKEHMAWLAPNDTFLAIFTKQENLNIKSSEERSLTFITGGFDKIKKYDLNNDNVYDYEDRINVRDGYYYLPLQIGYISDMHSDGTLIRGTGLQKFCDFRAIKFLNLSPAEDYIDSEVVGEGELICVDNIFSIKEIRFKYEKS